MIIAYIQLHKQIAKAVYNWNANKACAAMWFLLHCETQQATHAAGTAYGSPTDAHTCMYVPWTRQKFHPQYLKDKLYLFICWQVKDGANNAFF